MRGCGNISSVATRREALRRIGGGLGSLGLAVAMGDNARAAESLAGSNPMAARKPHFPGKAKRVIHLFMNGGPSHVDTFDPKPALAKYHGQRPASLNRRSTQSSIGWPRERSKAIRKICRHRCSGPIPTRGSSATSSASSRS